MAVAPVKRPAFAPPAAAGNLPITLDDQVGAVANELPVNAENRSQRRLHLRERIVRSLECPNGNRNEHLQSRNVVFSCQPWLPAYRNL